MHTLFNLNPGLNVAQSYPQNWHTVRAGLRENITKTIKFYRRNPMAVASNHFLVRLLQSITVPQSQNIYRYYDNVSAISLNLSMALKMTSSIYQGRLFPGTFYGVGTKEILIAHDTSFDPVLADKNWQNLCPVRVLRHPRSDLALNLPDGEATGAESGLAVIAINIPMLAVQYRAFRNEELRIFEQTGESMRSLMMFIHMYVLPNMLFSQTDVALFNRYHHYHVGEPIGESYKKHSFYLIDYSKRVDDVISTVLAGMGKTRRGFLGILRNTPMITKDTADEVMTFPDVAPTKQVLWGLTVAALPGLEYMLSVSAGDAKNRNQQEINKIKRTLIWFDANSYLNSVMGGDALLDVVSELRDIEFLIDQA